MKLSVVLVVVAFAVAGCSKKSDDKPAEPPKTDPAKPKASGDSLAAAPEAKVVEAAKAVLGGAKKELAWTSPSGDQVALAVKQVWKSNKAVVELAATSDGKTATLVSYSSDVEKDDLHYEAVGAVGAAADGSIVFVAGMNKITGKAANYYDAYVFTWDAATKQLKQARKHYWEDVYDPAMDK